MTRLRQLCCDQRILYNNVQEPSSKLKACMDIIETAKENEQKVLLFSSFTKSLDLIEAELRKKIFLIMFLQEQQQNQETSTCKCFPK